MSAILSILFVLIWSTGFIVAKGILPHAAPQPFLVMRMLLSALLLAAIALLRRDRWPTGPRVWSHLFTGALLNGVYLCFAYTAIWRGMPAGIMALLSSAQPVGIAVWVYFARGEKLPRSGVLGLVMAVFGVIFVLEPDLANGQGGHIDAIGLAAAILAVTGMAVATTIQRSGLASDPVSVSTSLQNAGGIPVALAATMLDGNRLWDGTPALWGLLAWSVIGLSAAGVSLVVWLSRHNGPAKMSALLLAVPPLSALEAFVLFSEKLMPMQIIGFFLAIAGVFLTRVPASFLLASLSRIRSIAGRLG
ncbi:DMT family transporter [Rhizobium sp. BK251]|uniref:DMT family transporter n=1 Tax=Rhizobium sp. BK251 TaxID=2512125 RepID=UPI0010D4C247|nr:DMT family transporter [Rhizobium sp. BK251]TCL67189.1 EamA-like transporter family protein [Rhizobium sp. BK251]